MARTVTVNEFIGRARQVHGSLYDYSKVQYKAMNTKVVIIDPEYGAFEITPANHLAGKGHTLRGKRPRYTSETFGEAAKRVHDNLYTYAKVNYQNSQTKVCVTDPEYGDFWVTPANHLKGRGHPTRGRNRTVAACRERGVSEQAFLARSRLTHGELYDYSCVNYVNTHTKVQIIDRDYGSFWQTPYKHMAGQNHPKRAKAMQAAGYRNDTKTFISKARLVHGDQYDYSKVQYVDSKTPVIIIDPEFGEFEQIPSVHVSGSGCPARKGLKISEAKTRDKAEFVRRAVAIHGDRYDYSQVDYVSAKTPVTIVDPDYGPFQQTPDSHLNKGSGSPWSRSAAISQALSSSTSEFIEKAIGVHGKQYDYSRVIYVSAKTPVTIIDPDYGEFEQTPDGHLAGHGHPLRGVNSAREKRSLPVPEFIQRAILVHGNTYDYSKVSYSSISDKVTIIDPDYGEFEQVANSHLQGSGHPSRAKYGFDTEQPAILYYLRVRNGTAYKIGITNRSVADRFRADMEYISVIETWFFERGVDALAEEQRLLADFSDAKYLGPPLLMNGNSELFVYDVLQLDGDR